MKVTPCIAGLLREDKILLFKKEKSKYFKEVKL